MSSCIFTACSTKAENKGRKEGRETNKAIPNEAAGRRGDNSPTPTPSQKQSASCSFQNEGDGCVRQIPPTLLSGWLPPTARGAAHLQPVATATHHHQ